LQLLLLQLLLQLGRCYLVLGLPHVNLCGAAQSQDGSVQSLAY
jgi:hypothetical protein